MSAKKTDLTERELELLEQKSSSSSISKKIKKAVKKTSWKTRLLVLGLIVAVLAVAFTSYKLITRVGGGMTPQGIRNIAQLATIEYRYRDVIAIVEEEEFMLFGLVDIDPGEHILIMQYDGIIKLGIDCEKILFNEYEPDADGRKRIEIKLPAVELISSETPMSSFKEIVNRGVFTKTKVDVGVFFNEAAKRQEQYNKDALTGDLATTARDNAKKQLQAMFDSFSEIKENYDIVWFD